MSGPVVVNLTSLEFDPEFEYRQVSVIEPPFILGTGTARINGQPICVLGDEKLVFLEAMYEVEDFSPGSGIVSILSLGPDQEAPTIRNGLSIITQGSEFVAMFTPTAPATNLETGAPDPPAPSTGMGRFLFGQELATVI